MEPSRNDLNNLQDGLPPSLDNPATSSGGNIQNFSRPQAGYSPLGATDSGYQTDSPQLSMDTTGTLAGSFEASRAASSSGGRRETPPPGYFRPVSPQPLPPSVLAAGHQRHVATQTFQQQSQLPNEQHFSQRPFEPVLQRQIPLYHSQQSTGFRPASAPLYDLPDGASGVNGVGLSNGVLSNGDDAELEDDYDEEVYRSSAAVSGGTQPLPDLLQLRTQSDAARLRSRSVPVPDERSRQERVAQLLREIGDQYNQTRVSPASLFHAPWLLRGNVGQRLRNRDRRISLRLEPTEEAEMGAAGEDWRGSIMSWVTRIARTLSGADIAREDDEEAQPGEDD